MDELRIRRIARNQAFFRDVNHRMGMAAKGVDPHTELEFVCECGDITCTERIRMSLMEYRDLRSDDTAFAIVPGHETADSEVVIDNRERYERACKTGAAADVAKESAPRRPRGVGDGK